MRKDKKEHLKALKPWQGGGRDTADHKDLPDKWQWRNPFQELYPGAGWPRWCKHNARRGKKQDSSEPLWKALANAQRVKTAGDQVIGAS